MTTIIVVVDDKIAQRLQDMMTNSKLKDMHMTQEIETEQDKTKLDSSQPEKTDINFVTDDQTVKKGTEPLIATAKDQQRKQIDQNKTGPQNSKTGASEKTTEENTLTIGIHMGHDPRLKELMKKVIKYCFFHCYYPNL